MKHAVRLTAILACWIAIAVEVVILPAKVVSLLLTSYASGVADELEGK
jgi:hypothetical protein